ncbi:hypothetical protein [uncultured Methylobacterium sp.]|uniref:hypothetical protein n=1 Tax=uncultured Methylobacterium sp. TaxID=157278 RepID=UPI0035CA31B5
MLYHAPAGSNDPNASYSGKLLAQQQQGSKVSPKAIEAPQREIVNVIGAAGLVPTDDDWFQLLRAIRGGQTTTMVDTSVTPGVITVGTVLAHTAYLTGLPIDVVLNQDVVGDTFISLNGLPARRIGQNGGGLLAKGDYLKGDIITLRYNGPANFFTVLTPVNNVIIRTALIKTIGGAGADFADINAANFWASRRRVDLNGFLRLVYVGGLFPQTVDQNFQHLDSDRISLEGASLRGSQPLPSALRYTGNDAGSRYADTAANLTSLRYVYQTELAFVGGRRLYIKGGLSNLQDIIVTSDGTLGDNIVLRSGDYKLTRMASVGAGYRGIGLAFATVYVAGINYGLGCGSTGISAESASTVAVLAFGTLAGLSNGQYNVSSIGGSNVACADFTSAALYSRAAGDVGIIGNNGSVVGSTSSVSRDCVNVGASGVNGGAVNLNGMAFSGSPIAIQAGQNCYVSALNCTGTATNVFGSAFGGGVLNRAGASGTGANGAYAPAIGQVSSDGGRVI